ncbi:MAG: phosphate/phosphite/phosphonate ABC transporter substrate-binding protein [Anaerolineales bacterium]
MRKYLFALMTLLLVAAMGLTGCGGEADLGTEENPIIWAFVPSGETQTVTTGAEELSALLTEETGLYFEVLITTEYAGAVEAMCADPAEAQMGSLNTFSYILANERCGVEAELVAVRYGSPTYNGQIIANVDSGIQSLEDLEGATFCRVDPLSTSGWIIPMLTMRANGINPDTDIEVVDAGSHDAVAAAVYSGDCDAGATFVDARGNIEEDNPDVMDVVQVIATTADIPNDGVQFMPGMDEELKTTIIDALLAISETEEGKDALDTAYSWAGLEKHGDDFYDPFRQVLEASGMSIQDLQD